MCKLFDSRGSYVLARPYWVIVRMECDRLFQYHWFHDPLIPMGVFVLRHGHIFNREWLLILIICLWLFSKAEVTVFIQHKTLSSMKLFRFNPYTDNILIRPCNVVTSYFILIFSFHKDSRLFFKYRER